MSDDTDDFPLQLDLREQIARIDRDRAETAMLSEEARKLTAESLKLAAEQMKFTREAETVPAQIHKLAREAEKYRAEEMKLWRDWRIAPWVLAAGIIGGLIARLIH